MLRPASGPSARVRDLAFATLITTIASVGLLGVAGCDLGVQSEGEGGEVVPLAPKPPLAESLSLVIPEDGILAVNIFSQVIRNLAAREGLICDVSLTAPGGQPEAVRRQIDGGATAIIVVPEPGRAEDLLGPLSEAKEAGIPAIVLGDDLPGSGVVSVHFDDPAGPARQIVERSIAAAKAAGLPESARVLLLVNGPHDEAGRRRLEALRSALREAGVEDPEIVRFSGYQDQAQVALSPYLEPAPATGEVVPIRMILAIEDHGIGLAAKVRDEADPAKPRFVIASFIEDDKITSMNRYNIAAALAERNLVELARRAFATIERLLAGETVESPVVVATKMSLPTGEEIKGYFLQPGLNVERPPSLGAGAEPASDAEPTPDPTTDAEPAERTEPTPPGT